MKSISICLPYVWWALCLILEILREDAKHSKEYITDYKFNKCIAYLTLHKCIDRMF